jgi:hypothetical protein
MDCCTGDHFLDSDPLLSWTNVEVPCGPVFLMRKATVAFHYDFCIVDGEVMHVGRLA